MSQSPARDGERSLLTQPYQPGLNTPGAGLTGDGPSSWTSAARWFARERTLTGMPIRDDVAAYFQAYDRDSFNVFAAGANAPSEAEVEAFEQQIGFRLPQDFREFTLSELGGLYIEVREELWPRPKLFDVGPSWTFDYGFMVFGLSRQAPEWLDLRAQYEAFSADTGTNLVPILKGVTDADRYCAAPDGSIVHWSHDEPDDPSPVNESFSDVLMQELAEIEERLEHKRQTATGV